jgi:hypothetical protein
VALNGGAVFAAEMPLLLSDPVTAHFRFGPVYSFCEER